MDQLRSPHWKVFEGQDGATGAASREPDYRATSKSCLDLRMLISLNVDLCPNSKSEVRAAPQNSITTAACILGPPPCGHLPGSVLPPVAHL